MGGDIIGERLRMTVNGQSGRRRRAVRIPGCYTFVRHLGKMGPPSSLLFLTVVGNGGWGGRAGERIVSEKTRERIKKSVKVIIVIISINWHQTRVLPFIKEREVKESWQHREKKNQTRRIKDDVRMELVGQKEPGAPSFRLCVKVRHAK